MNEQLRKELIRDEGLRLRSYRDSVGLWTIGVGHLLGETERMTEITFEEASALLEHDARIATATAARIIGPFDFDSTRGRALVNMAFNLGSRLAGFRNFVAAVKAQDWMLAGREMADSKWAGQVGDRAKRLRKMIETGAEDYDGT